MKSRTLTQGLYAVVLICALALSASAADSLMIINVPFEFQVGSVRMPAGQYAVSSFNTNGVLLIRNTATSDATFTHSFPVSGKIVDGAPALVFHRYDKAFFLAKVQGASSFSAELPMPKAELEYVSRSVRPIEVALRSGN